MLRRILRAAISATFTAAIVGAWLIPIDLRPTASATGNGPTIELGLASGLDVAVNATESPDAYMGFNLHVSAVPSAGVVLTAISGSFAGSTLAAGDLFCTTDAPAVHEVNYGCVALEGQSTTAPGLLATMSLNANGNGCVTVTLVDLPLDDPNAVVSDTYTVDQLTTSLQQNTVGTGAVQVIVGTGTLANCIAPASVGGVAQPPDIHALAAPGDGRSHVVAVIALAIVFAAVASTWYARLPRRP